MISATVYGLVIVPVVLVAFGLLALAWTSASAARIDRARTALSAQGGMASAPERFDESGRRLDAPSDSAGRTKRVGTDAKTASVQTTPKAPSSSSDSEKSNVDA